MAWMCMCQGPHGPSALYSKTIWEDENVMGLCAGPAGQDWAVDVPSRHVRVPLLPVEALPGQDRVPLRPCLRPVRAPGGQYGVGPRRFMPCRNSLHARSQSLCLITALSIIRVQTMVLHIRSQRF